MKNIKTLLNMLTLLLLTSCNTYAQDLEVGEVVSGVPTITVDKPSLMTTYSANLLTASGLNYNFTDVTIEQHIELEDTIHYLLFVGTDDSSNNAKSSMIASTSVVGGTTIFVISGKASCSTSDCMLDPDHCIPGHTFNTCIPCLNPTVDKCTRTISTYNMCR
ncbi:MAG: hypothetical protein KJP21_01320 [Bacteroidia bacterium]|nr:hypothetical protein [Bacteroidia bacterium]NNJ55363.1 hypothetical protein [Bacteroidia bacterium]